MSSLIVKRQTDNSSTKSDGKSKSPIFFSSLTNSALNSCFVSKDIALQPPLSIVYTCCYFPFLTPSHVRSSTLAGENRTELRVAGFLFVAEATFHQLC